MSRICAARRLLPSLILLWPALSAAQSPLEDCAAQFIDDDVDNAPNIGSSAPNEPFLSNVHQCYRDDGVSFFAMEYWPEEFMPRWVAYKLTPEDYGANGCSTFTRDGANCYIRADTWPEFLTCDDAADPFHSDHMLAGTTLSAETSPLRATSTRGRRRVVIAEKLHDARVRGKATRSW